MSDFDKNPVNKDWELEDGFYQEGASKKEISIEDFIDDGNIENSFGEAPNAFSELEKAASEIREVLKLAGKGKHVEAIAAELNLSADYVSQIQICAQSFPEDNAMAIARLLVMG